MINFPYRGPEILEFKSKDPLPGGFVCSINNLYVIQVYSSQLDIDKTYTVRGIITEHINPNESHKPKTMNLDVIKKELANLGFSKAHADVMLDAIKCIPTDPAAYVNLNQVTTELRDLRAYKLSVSSALKGLEAVAGIEKPKAPVKKAATTKVKEKAPAIPPLTAELGGKGKIKDAPKDNPALDRGAHDDLAASGIPDKLDM